MSEPIRDPDLIAELEASRGSADFAAVEAFVAAKQRARDNGVAPRPVLVDPLSDPEVRDDDLRAHLEPFSGQLPSKAYEAQRTRLVALQKSRDAVAGKRARMGRDQARRDAIREVIETEAQTPADIQHIHSVLALCGLPYREPVGQRDYSKEYGRNSLTITAGHLMNPVTGKMEMQGLPYGPKARLLLLHLCTEAVRQRSARIEVAESLSGFIRDMGFPVTGGERGTLRQFKEQLNRLAACQMALGLWDGKSRSRTLQVPPFKQLDVWFAGHPDQGTMWSSTIQFHQDFYENLIDHALPVDIRAARAVAGSARKLDLLFWLGYRLRNLSRPLRLTWDNLKSQFGADNANIRSFRQEFRKDVSHLQELFPKLRIDLDDTGLLLHPVDPDSLLVGKKRDLTIKRVGSGT